MPKAYLLDLDGTLYQGNAAIPGARELITRLRRANIPFRFVTNTTSRPRSALVQRLRDYGFEVEPEEIFTALMAGAQLARIHGCRSLMPLVTPAALEDLEGFELVSGQADAVIVGDLGELWSFDLMQQAFQALVKGAFFIALSHDRYWMSASGLTIDCGAFVKALEYATIKDSILAGKPSPAFYQAAVASLELPADTPASEIVMVGDDVRSDVGGAQRAGYRGYLVRTGKFREESLAASGVIPDRLLDSIAALDSSLPASES